MTCDAFNVAQEKKGIIAVHDAVRLGVNFFDVSPYYGRTRAETVLGKALREIPRDRFVLSTKVGRYDIDTFDFSAERVVKSVDESMARLGVDYIDIIQCHDIEFGDLDQVITETIPALKKLKEAGKVRAIGITGYPLEIFPYVLSCVEPGSVDVMLSYCHYCLQNDRLGLLLDRMKREQIGVINASALCMGLLTERGPPSWHPAPEAVKAKAREASAVCFEEGTALSTVALRYALNADPAAVASTLVGIDSTETLTKNIEIFHSPFNAEMTTRIRSIFEPVKNVRWDSGRFLA